MESKILINAVDTDECRIAKIKDNKLQEFHLESATREITQGNIYKAVITRVEPSLQAVFVEYGGNRHGFLQKQEIHSDYYLADERSKITDLVSVDQELIVQITKDPIMKKGAMLTTNISLPGRYVVLMPGSTNCGVSRQISSDRERARLNSIIEKLELPEGFGIIVRTAGEHATKTQLSKDINYLMRLWKEINRKATSESVPSLLYKERNLAVRTIRDYFSSDVTEILIDNLDIYREIKAFLSVISPKQIDIVKLHKGAKPIFTKYQLEHQIASVFENKVSLRSGGSIVIEQTEALVAIDVNSGKATSKKDIEHTALQTNLDAAEEVARQLRLRDMGGLIVIDFIDMREAKNRSQIENQLKIHLKDDKARTKVGRISKFGLMEMSRQRIHPSIQFGSFTTCKHCKGKGIILSVETLGLGFLRKLSLDTLKDDVSSITGKVPPDVADYLLNKKRSELLELEIRRGISISIDGDKTLLAGESKIICD